MFRIRKSNDSTRVLVRAAKRKGRKIDYYIGHCEEIFSEIPGSYITSPVLTSYLCDQGNDKPIGSRTLELWFYTEDDRKNGIEILRNHKSLDHLVDFVHEEVGRPEDVIPQHIGFTAGCMWIENHPRKGVAVFGLPDAPKDNKRKLLNIALCAFDPRTIFNLRKIPAQQFSPSSIVATSAFVRIVADKGGYVKGP